MAKADEIDFAEMDIDEIDELEKKLGELKKQKMKEDREKAAEEKFEYDVVKTSFKANSKALAELRQIDIDYKDQFAQSPYGPLCDFTKE
mgnify:CR=1 FL=1